MFYEYGCFCFSQTEGGGLFQAAVLAFSRDGSGECKQSKDGACSPAFIHVLMCPLDRSYLCVCLHLFRQTPGFEASIKLCLQWTGPGSLSDAWPDSQPLITDFREVSACDGCHLSPQHDFWISGMLLFPSRSCWSWHCGNSCTLSWLLFPLLQGSLHLEWNQIWSSVL